MLLKSTPGFVLLLSTPADDLNPALPTIGNIPQFP